MVKTFVCFLCQEKLTEEHIEAGSRFLKEDCEEVCEGCYIAETIKSFEQKEEMKQINTCYCNDPDHELCWDGIGTFANKDCPCCQNTLKDMEIIKNG